MAEEAPNVTEKLFEEPASSEIKPDAQGKTPKARSRLSVSLPYLATPGSLKTALDKIRQAATPERVTNDFIQNNLGMKGGNGAAITPFLKKIGMVASDASPTDLYKRFRNPTSGQFAMADAIKIGYKPLAAVSEYFYKMPDRELTNTIVQVTGAEANSSSVKQIVGTIKAMKEYASFESSTEEAGEASGAEGQVIKRENSEVTPPPQRQDSGESARSLGLNLSYTINLNLPATSDQAVFNAIFRSLKEHLLSNE